MTALTDKDLFARVMAKANEYLSMPCVVGHERPFLDFVARDFKALDMDVERLDKLCIINLGGEGPIYLAHADRHGAIITTDGTAVYAAHVLDTAKPANALPFTSESLQAVSQRYGGETVFAYDSRTGSHLAYGEVHSATLDDQGRIVFKLEDMADLPNGVPIAISSRIKRVKSGCVSGQLDNQVSLAALRIAAELGLKGQIIITAEEELGRSADHFLSWAQSGGLAPTHDLIVCDTSPFDDAAAALAGAVILRRRDQVSSFQASTISRLEAAATAAHVPIIFKDSFTARENDARARRRQPLKPMGLTELGQIIASSQGAYSGATLQLPTYNYTSNTETSSVKAITAFARTLLAL